jgi:hypothetical protein
MWLTPANSGGTYDLPRVCAMFDKTHLARYARGARPFGVPWSKRMSIDRDGMLLRR